MAGACAGASRGEQRAFHKALRKVTGKGLGAQTPRAYADSWLARTEHEVAAATCSRYQQTANSLLASLGGLADQDMALVKRDHLTAFRDSEAKRVAPATANLALKITGLLFKAAEADGVVLKNEARHVKPVKVERHQSVRDR